MRKRDKVYQFGVSRIVENGRIIQKAWRWTKSKQHRRGENLRSSNFLGTILAKSYTDAMSKLDNENYS